MRPFFQLMREGLTAGRRPVEMMKSPVLHARPYLIMPPDQAYPPAASVSPTGPGSRADQVRRFLSQTAALSTRGAPPTFMQAVTSCGLVQLQRKARPTAVGRPLAIGVTPVPGTEGSFLVWRDRPHNVRYPEQNCHMRDAHPLFRKAGGGLSCRVRPDD